MADCALWRLEQTTERVQIQRPVEIKTLDEITTGLSDQVEFVLGLHTFDTDLFAKKMCIRDRPALMEQETVDPQKASEPMLSDGGEAITDPSVTELTIKDGQELLTGGSISVAYFAQSDSAWKDKSYGNDPIGSYGCGPTVMAMAVQSMTGTKTDPEKMAAWCAVPVSYTHL